MHDTISQEMISHLVMLSFSYSMQVETPVIVAELFSMYKQMFLTTRQNAHGRGFQDVALAVPFAYTCLPIGFRNIHGRP
jgi:hypothetical protein